MTADEVRQLERESIAAFVASAAEQFAGARVLDFGCGLQPYRLIVEAAGGDYVGYDREAFPGNVSDTDVGPDYGDLGRFDCVLSTQMLQYSEEPFELLLEFRSLLWDGGVLVLTGPTNWPEVEPVDLFRFTEAGIGFMLREAGFDVLRLERRASVRVGPGFELSLGWGAVARA